jgi:hypothetical protein
MSYSWHISNIDYQLNKDGFTNVATCIHWRYRKEQTEANTVYVAERYGDQSLDTSGLDANTFVDWSSLSQNTVIEWLETSMSNTQIESLQSSLDENINLQINPVSSSGVPW